MRRIFKTHPGILTPPEGGQGMKQSMILALMIRLTVDYLLLMTANRIAHRQTGTLRLLLAAGVGAIHAGFCMTTGMTQTIMWRVLICGLMGILAFEMDRGFAERILLFLLLRFCVDGMASGTGGGNELLWAVVLGGIFLYGMRHQMGLRQTVEVELTHGSKTIKLQALRDTGNTLRDPVTGKSVLVVDANIADQLTGLTIRQISEPVETMGKVPGMRLIPYRAVGKTQGLMLALPVKRAKIGGRKGSTLVAFAPQILDESGKYQALLGQW